MKFGRPGPFLAGAALALLLFLVSFVFWLSPGPKPGTAAAAPQAEAGAKADAQPPASIDVSPKPAKPGEVVPAREITADHQPKRQVHKDRSGLPILEDVYTSEGIVKIHRTFRVADRKLLKEEAFLNGRPVPVPKL